MPEHNPVNYWDIDVKTKFKDKWGEIGMKFGSKAFINNTKNLNVVEYFEDVSLWIKDFIRIKSNKEIIIDFFIELQKPTVFFESAFLKKRHFTIKYDNDLYLEKVKGNIEYQVVAEKFRKYAIKCKKAGEITAYINNIFLDNNKLIPANYINKILERLISMLINEETWQIQQMEAVICGAEIYGQLKEWLWELEQENNYKKMIYFNYYKS